MSKFKAIHWIAIAATLLVTVLLFIAPKKGELKKPEMANKIVDISFDIKPFTDSVYTNLDSKTQALILVQQKLVNSNNNTELVAKAFDSLSNIYRFNKIPLLFAYSKVLKAQALKRSVDFAEAGETCYMTSRFLEQKQQAFLMNQAIDCYVLALKTDTNNVDYKTSLGICYVEAGTDPMKGITMLREIVAKDSTNIKAQTSLGMFAIQSGQNDKAVKRFKNIIKMQPNNTEAYLFLAQAYSNIGNKALAIESLQNFKKINTDKTVEEEINNYINDLKTN